jgi:hypothetical protein
MAMAHSLAAWLIESSAIDTHRTRKLTQPAIVLCVDDSDSVVPRLGEAVLRLVAGRNT